MAHQLLSSQPHRRTELVSDGAVEEIFWKGATGARGQDHAYMLQARLATSSSVFPPARMQFARVALEYGIIF